MCENPGSRANLGVRWGGGQSNVGDEHDERFERLARELLSNGATPEELAALLNEAFDLGWDAALERVGAVGL